MKVEDFGRAAFLRDLRPGDIAKSDVSIRSSTLIFASKLVRNNNGEAVEEIVYVANIVSKDLCYFQFQRVPKSDSISTAWVLPNSILLKPDFDSYLPRDRRPQEVASAALFLNQHGTPMVRVFVSGSFRVEPFGWLNLCSFELERDDDEKRDWACFSDWNIVSRGQHDETVLWASYSSG